MAMGSTGTVNITPEMMNNALQAVQDYRTTSNNLHTRLSETVTNLIPSSFSGNAAEGFKFFYDNQIEPVVGADLKSLLDSLEQIFNETLKAIPGENGLDDELGNGNRQ
jgi:uncharacterized protein YukE